MPPPTVVANEERARDIFRRLFDERDLTDPSWYWADDLITDLKALEMTVHGPDGMADFFTGIFAAMPDFAMEIEDVLAHERGEPPAGGLDVVGLGGDERPIGDGGLRRVGDHRGRCREHAVRAFDAERREGRTRAQDEVVALRIEKVRGDDAADSAGTDEREARHAVGFAREAPRGASEIGVGDGRVGSRSLPP